MKTALFQRCRRLAILVACALGFATTAHATVYVPTRVWVSGTVSDGLRAYGTFSDSAPGANDGYQIDEKTGSGLLTADLGTVLFEPGRTYAITIGGNGTIQDGEINVAPPPGYYAEIEQTYRNRKLTGYGVVRVILLPKPGIVPRQASTDISGATGKVDWRVSLGSLKNGDPAGELTLVDAGFSSSWAALFTPAYLDCEPTSTEVSVKRSAGGYIRQILANETVLDVVTSAEDTSLTANQYEIRFYNPLQRTGSAFPYGFTGQPYAVYRFEPGTTPAATSTALKITRRTYQLTGPTQTGVAAARTEVMMIQRTGTAWPNYDWVHNAWMETDTAGTTPTAVLSQRTVDSSSTDGGLTRAESATVNVLGGDTATRVSRNFALKSWGEAITSEKMGSSTTSAAVTSFNYYENPANLGSYSYVKSMTSTDGSWEGYVYHDATAATSKRAGTVKYRFRPYLNDPEPTTTLLNDPSALLATPSTSGEITEFDYIEDAFGVLSRPTLVETKVNGTLTAKSTTSYVETTVGPPNGMAIIEATQRDYFAAAVSYPDDTKSLKSIVRSYKESADIDPFFRSQKLSETRPTGVKVVFALQHGTWNGTAFTKNGAAGLTPADDSTSTSADTGSAARRVVITGTSASSAGATLYQTHDGYDIDDLYLIPGKSTMEVSIRGRRALEVRTEKHVWVGGAWQFVDAMNFTYNQAGQLLQRTAANGAVRYEATYNGRLRQSEKDEAGVETTYAYDAAGRLEKSTRTGGPTKTFVYDAAGRVKQDILSAAPVISGETITTTSAYDDGGRLISATPPGLGATTISYDYVNRKKSTLSPDGGTSEEITFRDGRKKQTTGTAVVAQYHAYGIETDGRRYTVTYSGSANSPRYSKTWTDWLGREIKTELPTFNASSQGLIIDEKFYAPTTGLLFKTTTSKLVGVTSTLLVAPTRYEYDVMGNPARSGLDLNDNGLEPNSTDRLTDVETVVESNSGLWVKTTNTAYPFEGAGAGTAKVMSVKRVRLNGFAATRLSEVQETDAEGKTVTTVTDVDRATKTVTTTVTTPGLTGSQITKSVNGLPDSTKDNDNLEAKLTYDSLGRSWKTTDTRGKITTTAYWPGTAMTQTVTDPTNTIVQQVSYDTSGRAVVVQDALGRTTRTAYNTRGQATHQWGDATYPVAHGYDSTYGERISMTTYQGGNPADWNTTNWPTSIPADASGSTVGNTTNWEYDATTGLLLRKIDAQLPGSPLPARAQVAFTYNVRGQLLTRTSARGVVATNYYYGDQTGEPNTGELRQTAYTNDPASTPAVTYTYSRAGQIKTVADGTGTRTFNYDASKPWRLNNEQLSANFGSLYLNNLYDETANLAGRAKGFKLGADADNGAQSASVLTQEYTYTGTGRFNSVISKRPSAADATFTYGYESNAQLISGYTTGANFSVVRTYDPDRPLLASIDSKWGADSVTKFVFSYDKAGQRKTALQSGEAFKDYWAGMSYSSVYNHYTYNTRGEVETAAIYAGNTVPAANALPNAGDEIVGRRSEYRYDSLGNRKNSGPTGDPNGIDDQYSVNPLNQYNQKENNSVRVTGTAVPTSQVAVTGGGAGLPVTARKDRAWVADIIPENTGGLVTGSATVYSALLGGGSGGLDLIQSDAKSFMAPKAVQIFGYDLDGNMTTDGVWDYTYDAENRLVAIQHRTDVLGTGKIALNNAKRLEFVYDYLGRRVTKIVKTGWSSGSGFGSVSTTQTKFIYAGWNLIAEYQNATTTTLGTLLRSFTWGLDLTGSLTASGGIGSLLQIWDAGKTKTYLPTYDGNGNVAAMLDSAASGLATVVQAAYEYTPFGQLLRSDGDYTVANPFRFSTKYTDLETKLIYYGHRYYSSELGRFINRDPIQEQGGLNLYGFCGNDGVNHWDYLGQWSLKKFFKKVARIVSPILTIVGMFIPPFAPIAMAINVGISAAAGVPLGEIVKGFVVGAVAGAIGGNIVGGIVGKTTTLVGTVASRAVGGAISGAIGAAVLGGDMGTAVLTGAAMAAIAGYAEFKLNANQPPIVQKPDSNQPLAPGQNGSLAAHGSDINVTPNQTFSEGSGMLGMRQTSISYGPMTSGSMDGWSTNPDGSLYRTDSGFDFNYAPALARVQLERSILDIQLKEIRARESTAYDWSIAVDYWANSGGVRGVAANLSADTPDSGPIRFSGSGGLSATIDNGLGAQGNFAGKVMLPGGAALSGGVGGSTSQLGGTQPLTYSTRLTGSGDPSTWTVASGANVGAPPQTVTFGIRRNVTIPVLNARVSVNFGVVVNPELVIKNFSDMVKGFQGKPIDYP